MGQDKSGYHMQSRIWLEEPEDDNAFAARAAYCHGYDVHGQMLGRSGWADMFYLLFRGEAPSPSQAASLDILAVALANPGPRDPSVHAAMCAGVGGSPSAAGLIAALSVGAGSLGGSREIALAMDAWLACGNNVADWIKRWLDPPTADGVNVFPVPEHLPGFDPHGVTTSTPVKQTMARLAEHAPDGRTAWLQANLATVAEAAGHPLSLSGVAAAALVDLGFSADEGEMAYLLLRLPGAAAHALEQRRFGHKKFPFYELEMNAETQP